MRFFVWCVLAVLGAPVLMAQPRYPFELHRQYGFVDSVCAVVIPPRFQEVTAFKGGRAFVREGRNVHHIDPQGNTICMLPQ